jgi:pimeloyl-ACP methyl ester carboxylesterase
MSVVLIILILAVVLFVGVSLALGRTAHEVHSARDTEYLELEGSWIRYNVIGGGPPVLLVHGWLSSSRVWEQLAGRLAQRFTVYTLDLTGFGESDKPLSGYGVRYGSRLLYAFCAHFGLTRTNVIGHDIGGDMAVKLAADHPDVVGRLVLVATPADDEQMDLPTPLWLATLPVVGPLFYSVGRLLRPVRRLWLRPFVANLDDLTEEAVEDAARSTPAAVGKTLSVTRREISGGRLARQARIIKVPVLLIAGERDQIVDPQAVGWWARNADQAEVSLLDGCGHMPMIERTAEFNAQVLAFLTGDERYLEYVEETSEADEEVEVEEMTSEPVAEREEDLAYREEEASDDATVDLTPREDGPAAEEEPVRDSPSIHQKRGGSYSRGDQETEPRDGSSGNGTEERARRDRPAPEDFGEGSVPEVPEHLFRWPDAWNEFRPPQRSRDRSTEERGEGDAPEDPDQRS